LFIYFGFVNERGHSIIRNWHSWKTSANRSICDVWMLNPITERGLNTNPMALVIEIMQDSFSVLVPHNIVGHDA
jgi:predicted metallopeptidase